MKHRTLTLCGEFGNEELVRLIHLRLSKAGFLVYCPPAVGLDPDTINENDSVLLDENILGCIEHSKGVFVIDPEGFQSAATKRHLAFARERNKIIFLLSKKRQEINGNHDVMNTLELNDYVTSSMMGHGSLLEDSTEAFIKTKRDRTPARGLSNFDMEAISRQKKNVLTMSQTIQSKLNGDV